MRISIAIPDTSLADKPTRLEKSGKISGIARACAIFGVGTIYIYHDGGTTQDRALLGTVLRYMETPAFLRRRLYPKMSELKYAGVLSPLKIPSHTVSADPGSISAGDVREGVVVSYKGRRFVDAGIDRPVRYFGQKQTGSRVTIQFRSGLPDLDAKEIGRDEAGQYWGYRVSERDLYGLLSGWGGRVILTSRRGRAADLSALREYAGSADPLLVAFGSTDRGVHEILGNRIRRVQNSRILNFFPGQSTETVRLEEAVLGVLAILKSGL